MQIFLLIGQSNMAGRGAVGASDLVPHPRVFMLTRELAWVPAVDPMHFDKPERIGTGLGKTFGAVLADADQAAVIGLVPAAFGGSALDEWTPGSPHYDDLIGLWTRGEYFPLLYSRAAIEKESESTITLTPFANK